MMTHPPEDVRFLAHLGRFYVVAVAIAAVLGLLFAWCSDG